MKNFINFLKQFYSTQRIKKGIVLFGGYSDAENVFFVLSEEGEINVFDNRSSFLKQVKKYISKLNTKYTLDKKM
jgi:hypothetical protein